MTDRGSIQAMVRDLDFEVVDAEAAGVALPALPGMPEDPAELRFVLEAGLFDIVVEAELRTLDSDLDRLRRIDATVRSVESLLPVTRYAFYDRSEEIRKRELSSRMQRREIDTTTGWMLPRLQRDIEAAAMGHRRLDSPPGDRVGRDARRRRVRASALRVEREPATCGMAFFRRRDEA